MAKYIVSRFMQAIIVLIGVTLVTFILVNVVPGDPIKLMLDKRADQQTIDRMRHEFGFDKPYHQQFIDFLGGAAKGDFGDSYFERVPVTSLIGRGLMYTVRLAIGALLLSVFAGLSFGILSAYLHNTIIDRAIMFISTLSISAPVFWLAVLFQILFGLKLGLLPISGVERAGSFILPTITLAIGNAASIARISRSSILDVISQDYVRTARAKGAGEVRVILKHVFKNACIPIITYTGLSIRGLLGGSMLVETVFSIPGFGSLMVSSIMTRDIPLIQGCVTYGAIIFVIINLVVDLAYSAVDPRVRLIKGV